MRRSWVAAGAAAVLVAGLATGAVALASRCSTGGGADGAVRPDTPVEPYVQRIQAADEATVLATLAAAGLPARVGWSLPTGVRVGEERLPEITATAVTPDGRIVLTVQERDERDRLVAGYDAATGALRWAAGLPPQPTAPELVPAAGLLLVRSAREVAALDPASGELRWCTATGQGSVTVLDVPDGVLVAEQVAEPDGSSVRLLDRGTGDERWSRRYQAHDGSVAPVATAGTVSVYAFDEDAGGAGTRTFRLAGYPAWSTTVEFPQPLAAGGEVLLLRTYDAVLGTDAASGRVVWSSPELAASLHSSGSVHLPARPGDPVVLVQDLRLLPDEPADRGGLTAFDAATGTIRWRLRGADLGMDTPGGVRQVDDLGGRLLVHHDDGLAVVDPATGRVLGTAADDPGVTASGLLAIAVTGSHAIVLRLE